MTGLRLVQVIIWPGWNVSRMIRLERMNEWKGTVSRVGSADEHDRKVASVIAVASQIRLSEQCVP